MNNSDLMAKIFILLRNKNDLFKDYELSIIKNQSLNELGMDSIGLVSFMVNLEDEFGIEWDAEKTNSDVLRSLSSISKYIAEELGYAI